LSSGTKGWSDFKISWTGSNFTWKWKHKNITGSVTDQQSGSNGQFYIGGTPVTLRVKINKFDEAYRKLGITDLYLWYSASDN
jgi:hypothetical protein